MAIDFITKLLNDPNTTAATVSLTNAVLVDETFRAQTVSLAHYIVAMVIAEQSTTDQVVILLKKYAQIWVFLNVKKYYKFSVREKLTSLFSF